MAEIEQLAWRALENCNGKEPAPPQVLATSATDRVLPQVLVLFRLRNVSWMLMQGQL